MVRFERLPLPCCFTSNISAPRTVTIIATNEWRPVQESLYASSHPFRAIHLGKGGGGRPFCRVVLRREPELAGNRAAVKDNANGFLARRSPGRSGRYRSARGRRCPVRSPP